MSSARALQNTLLNAAYTNMRALYTIAALLSSDLHSSLDFGEVPLALEFGSMFSLNLSCRVYFLLRQYPWHQTHFFLAYLQDLLVADYCSTGRLTVFKDFCFIGFFESISRREDPWKSLRSVPAPAPVLHFFSAKDRAEVIKGEESPSEQSSGALTAVACSCNYGVHQLLKPQMEKPDI